MTHSRFFCAVVLWTIGTPLCDHRASRRLFPTSASGCKTTTSGQLNRLVIFEPVFSSRYGAPSPTLTF